MTVPTSGAVLTVAGTYQISGATSVSTFGCIQVLSDATTGALNLSSGGSITGPGTLTATGLFTWTGGSMIGPGRTVAQGGMRINVQFGIMRLDGRVLDNAGTATWVGGQVGRIEAVNGAVINNLEGATFDIQAGEGICGGAASFNNAGLLRRAAESFTQTQLLLTFTNTGTVEVERGTLLLSGTFTNFSGMTLTGGTYVVRGALRFTNADIRANAAAIVLDGPAARVINQFSQDAVAKLSVITPAGSLTLQGGRQLVVTEEFVHAGALAVLGAGSAFATTRGYTQTAGTTTLAGGTLTALTVDIQGGVLSGSGTINAAVVINAGRISVGGTGAAGLLVINGDYTQAGPGVLEVELGGLEPGTQFDQLRVSGTAMLDGTLSIALLDAFFAGAGDSFRMLEFGARQSDFAAFSGLDVGGLVLVPVFDDTGLTLVAVALP